MRQTLDEMNAKKGNELYLEWLERNHKTIDPSNYKMVMNMQAHDVALNYSTAPKRQQMKQALHMRRFTSNQTLEPPYIGGSMADCKEFLLPDIHNLPPQGETKVTGRWKNDAVLQAMDKIKRNEVFKALREANG